MKTVVVATRNLAKSGEMVTILHTLLPDWKIKTLLDYEAFPEPEESGDSYEENAIIKAEAARDAVRDETAFFLADDAGLEVEALGGEPGVRSKRFAGEDTSFQQKMGLILSRLDQNRAARFQCCVALTAVGKQTVTFCATKAGEIAPEPRGEQGFGYDPIFLLPELGKTYSELTPELKNTISHRYIVLRLAADWLSRQ